MQVNAADEDGIDGDIYLVGGFNSWNTSANKFEKINKYEFVITLTGDVLTSYKSLNYFKLYVANWDSKYVGPWNDSQNAINTTATTSKNLSAGENSNFYISNIDNSAVGLQIYVKWSYHESYDDNKWQFDITATSLDKEYTVAFVNKSDWENVYLYAWNGDHKFLCAWPGEKLTVGTDEAYYKTFYANSSANIIFNNNNDKQTQNLTLSDDGVYDSETVSGQVGRLVPSINLSTSDKYATFSSEYPLDFSEVTAVKAYRASETSSGHVGMTQVTGTVPAKTGLFIKTENGSSVSDIAIPTTATPISVGTNYLVAGTDAGIAASAAGSFNYVFALQGGDYGFYKITSANATDMTGKAYLHTTSDIVPSTGARVVFTFDDDITGISSIKSNASANGAYYNLAGQRVAQPTKGLYIVNGKKVIMK